MISFQKSHIYRAHHVTDTITHLVAEISDQVGVITAVKNESMINPQFRKENQIRTIHSSLSLEQVNGVINGKRILGAPTEIKEVKNAFEAYTLLLPFDPYSIEDILNTHKILMLDLTKQSGQFRSGGVGVFKQERLVHMAPAADFVPKQIEDLLQWAKNAEPHPLITSCIFHYEFEFIHPFFNGNGRMGRMWQTLLLSQLKPAFSWLPVQTLIKERQSEYYKALEVADKAGESTAFIEFMLNTIRDALLELIQTDQVDVQVTDQVQRLLAALGKETLSSKELLERLELKHRPTFSNNYLRPALELRLIEMTVPNKPNSSKQKYFRSINLINSL